MFIDTQDETPNGIFDADICIVGSGPAGISLARELSRSHLRICLLESGGSRTHPTTADLNRGEVDSPHGYRSETLHDGRRRQLGGTSNLWNHEMRGQRGKFIRYVALDEIDFERRDWIPGSGWPFSRKDLAPYYQRAHQLCGIGPFDYSSATWRREDASAQPWETQAMESVVSQFGSASVFLKDYLEELHRAPNVYLFTRSTLVTLRTEDRPDVISSAEVARANGSRFLVRAPRFVLANGGLENARTLLLNEATRNGGPGNQHDMVGRCFMDHPSITLGTLRPFSGEIYNRAAFYDQRFVDGQPIMGKLHLREEVMRREKLLNACAVLVPHFRDLRSNLPAVLKQLTVKGPGFILRHRTPDRCFSTPGGADEAPPTLRQRLLEGYYSECFCGWSRLSHKEQRFGEMGVRSLVEQAPDRSNRIILGEELDALGQQRGKVIWRWNEIDLRSIRRTQQIFRSELATAGIGDFAPSKESSEGVPRTFYSPHHFLGSTRMHENPREGVVDADCRVHGLHNLYVAGSSVFPTGGFANPTITIVALAVRLADHLREEARAMVEVAEAKSLVTQAGFAE